MVYGYMSKEVNKDELLKAFAGAYMRSLKLVTKPIHIVINKYGVTKQVEAYLLYACFGVCFL